MILTDEEKYLIMGMMEFSEANWSNFLQEGGGSLDEMSRDEIDEAFDSLKEKIYNE